jgi:ribosomal protein L18
MIVAVVGLPLVAYLLTTASAFLRSKAEEIKDKHSRELIQQAITAVEQAVLFVAQTYVDSLKRAGKFDITAQQKALLTAKTAAIEMINDNMKAAIEDGYGSFDTWLDTRIEQTVRATKK